MFSEDIEDFIVFIDWDSLKLKGTIGLTRVCFKIDVASFTSIIFISDIFL